jgi:hypothetical protein
VHICESGYLTPVKKEVDFRNAQMVATKDMEISFDILQAQFTIVRGPTRFWDSMFFGTS